MSIILYSCYRNGYYCQVYRDRENTAFVMRLSLDGKTVLTRRYNTMKAAKQGIRYYTEL